MYKLFGYVRMIDHHPCYFDLPNINFRRKKNSTSTEDEKRRRRRDFYEAEEKHMSPDACIRLKCYRKLFSAVVGAVADSNNN